MLRFHRAGVTAADLLPQIDRLTSITASAGKTLIFTSDGTNSFLQHSQGDLGFKDSGGTQRAKIHGPSNVGLSIQGNLLVGRGIQTLGVNPPPGSSSALLNIAEKMSVFPWTTAAYWQPTIDADVIGSTITLANFVALFTNPFESTDSGGLEAHWDVINDGAVADASHGVTTTAYIAQTFTMGAAIGRAFLLDLVAYRTGNPGTAIAEIYAVDGAGKPTGLVITTSTALDVSAITTLTSGEDISISFPVSIFYFGNLSAATKYALRVRVTGAGTMTVLSDETSGGFPGQNGWVSADSGATWTDITPGTPGLGTFLFAFSAYHGIACNFTACNFQLGGSFAGAGILGWATNARMIDINTNISVPAGSPAWTNLHGIDIRTLSVAGGTAPTRSAGLVIGTAGNGTTSWGIRCGASLQVSGANQLILGGTTTTKGTGYWSQRAAGFITGAIASTNVVELSATAWYPITNGGPTLGQNGQGWKSLICKDTAAAFENTLQFTSTAIAADSTLTFDLGTASRTITLSGNPTIADWFDQNVKTTGTPQHARMGIGIAADGTALLKLAAGDVLLDTTTGTKIGTATTQKLGLWGVVPVIQPAGALQAALTNSTGGTQNGTLVDVTTAALADPIKCNDNFTDIFALLDAMRTAMVSLGSLKGAA